MKLTAMMLLELRHNHFVAIGTNAHAARFAFTVDKRLWRCRIALQLPLTLFYFNGVVGRHAVLGQRKV